MKKVKFNVGSKLFLVSFPDDVSIRYFSTTAGTNLPYFCFHGNFRPVSDVLNGDFGYQVEDLSAKKKSIYCNDEEFSIAKAVIDILRRADNGVFSSNQIFSSSNNILTVSVRPANDKDFYYDCEVSLVGKTSKDE